MSLSINKQSAQDVPIDQCIGRVEVHESYGRARNAEMVRVGVPIGVGQFDGTSALTVSLPGGRDLPAQYEVTGTWPDGSVQWAVLSFPIDLRPCESQTLDVRRGRPSADSTRCFSWQDDGASVDVELGEHGVRLQKSTGSFLTFRSPRDSEGPVNLSLNCVDAKGRQHHFQMDEIHSDAQGENYVSFRFMGGVKHWKRLRCEGQIAIFPTNGLLKIDFTIHNPARARHKGGVWDLGDPASVSINALSLDLDSSTRLEDVYVRPTLNAESVLAKEQFCVYQESSGGENWNSRNHVNRHGVVPLTRNGFIAEVDDAIIEGTRATPIVAVRHHDRFLGLTVEDFWQKFPSEIDSSGNRLRYSLLPKRFPDLHEIQPGEQTTRTVWLLVDKTEERIFDALSNVHLPVDANPDPTTVADSNSIWCFPDANSRITHEMQHMLDAALDGPNGLLRKREAVDEYGWRNFGDIWADHESTYFEGPAPIISHYNNQYDVLHSMLVYYLWTKDERWLQFAHGLAGHILDIDIYHTSCDKPGYRNCMFWHTTHYHDAGRATHRSISQSMLNQEMVAAGGGPGIEHLYSSGLLLYYQITGNERARRAVTDFGQAVIDMDDGSLNMLGILSDQRTGNASRTAELHFHGPGRGAGNAVNALVDAWQLTKHRRFFEKIDEILRRSIHPHDDPAQLDFGNAELRWSYTVGLQSFFRFLCIFESQPDARDLCSHVRASLLKYAKWMAENEYFYLDRQEMLEYPTETWAAQELRKGNVLILAAHYARNETERTLFRARGEEILSRAWQQLLSFDTHDFARPLAIALQQGYLEAFLTGQLRNVNNALYENDVSIECRTSRMPFVDQKQSIKAQLKNPRDLVKTVLHATSVRRWSIAYSQSWLRQQVSLWLNK